MVETLLALDDFNLLIGEAVLRDAVAINNQFVERERLKGGIEGDLQPRGGAYARQSCDFRSAMNVSGLRGDIDLFVV